MINFTLIALGAIAVYFLAFRYYGNWISKVFDLSQDRPTPATVVNDGEDFVPTSPSMLLGQHFSAIAAVGPIAGPILAGVQYGWMTGLFWIVFGAVFIGAVHDFSALVASVRHKARSIGDLMKEYLGTRAAFIFSIYIWLSLIYVIVVFTDLTASAFVNRPALGEHNFGPGVATSSLLYLVLAVIMGAALYRFKIPLRLATIVFVPAIFVLIWAGQKIPIVFSGDALQQQRSWDIVILIYCFFASVIPMWVLLQPRGYLGGFILYSTFFVGIVGILFGKVPIEFPATQETLGLAASPAPLFPLLFTTIACGACSGFHGLVASGTSSKQLRRETDAKVVGYGGMLLESLLAVIAMATLMMLRPGSPELKLGPDEIYARGLAHFMQVFGIPFAAGVTFGKLAFATFIYDTLDVSTRLGRYVLQEITGLKGKTGAILATLATLLVPVVCVLMPFHDAQGNAVPLWKIFWPAFGASNQLLAALTLTGITVWLKKEGRNFWVTGLPAVFMVIVTMSSLWTIVRARWTAMAQGGSALDPVGLTAIVLLVLAVGYLGNAVAKFFQTSKETAAKLETVGAKEAS